MRKGKWVVFILFWGLSVVSLPSIADEDLGEFQFCLKPNFEVSGKIYGKFQTPIYRLAKGFDNLLISVDIEKSPLANFRSYARFRYSKTRQWTRFQEFETECHFSEFETVDAYQLVFVVLDLSKGTNRLNRITVQGKTLGVDLMKILKQKPLDFVPAVQWPKPPIVSREEWKARPPKGEYSAHKPEKIILHHTWLPAQAQYAGSSTIRGIQNYHMDDPSTGWMDIGYHFLIGPDGLIYQGRPEDVVGAHCPPNVNMVGVCVIGNYDPNHDLLNEKIETSLINLLSWLSSNYKIDPRLYYYGHRNFSSKTCPGDIVYDQLPKYRELVLKNIGEKK